MSLLPLTRDPGTGLGPSYAGRCLTTWPAVPLGSCTPAGPGELRTPPRDRPDDACSRRTEEARGSWPCVCVAPRKCPRVSPAFFPECLLRESASVKVRHVRGPTSGPGPPSGGLYVSSKDTPVTCECTALTGACGHGSFGLQHCPRGLPGKTRTLFREHRGRGLPEFVLQVRGERPSFPREAGGAEGQPVRGVKRVRDGGRCAVI